MWKKVLIALTVCLGILSAANTYFGSLNAATVTYYPKGTTALIGGMHWEIIAQNGNGIGYLGSQLATTVQYVGCNSSPFITASQVPNCAKTHKNYFASHINNNDYMGKLILQINGTGIQPKMMSLQTFQDMKAMNPTLTRDYSRVTWMSDIVSGHTLLYGSAWVNENSGNLNGYPMYNGMPNIRIDTSTSYSETENHMSMLLTSLTLPQSNQIEAINASNVTTNNAIQTSFANQRLTNISVTNGEGPYRLAIENVSYTDNNGNTTTANDTFRLSTDSSDGISTSGSADVINTKNLSVGTYTITYSAVDESTNYRLYLDTADFSLDPHRKVTKSVTVTVKEALPVLTYQPYYEEGASTVNQYEYLKNVKVGQRVGILSVNSDSYKPITYELTSIDGSDNGYENFKINNLNSDGSSNATALNVVINNNAPALKNGSLKAGSYSFCITAKDKNGIPTTSTIENGTKVCTTLTVNKTQPTITFDNDDNGNTYIISDPVNENTHLEHAKHTNTDISANDVDIEYYYSGGTSGLIAGLPFTSQNVGDKAELIVTANKTGSIKLQAKIAETENYLAAVTGKTIVVNLGITGRYIEYKTNIKAGSADAKPPTN